MWGVCLLVSLLCSHQGDFSIYRQVIHWWNFVKRFVQFLFNLGVVPLVLIHSNDVLSFWKQKWISSSFLAFMIITCTLVKDEVYFIKTLFACKLIRRIFSRFIMVVWVDKMTHQMVRLQILILIVLLNINFRGRLSPINSCFNLMYHRWYYTLWLVL